jgi:Na+-translocating ferredoxin:NAD+ oxidoreductase RnfD subunit
MIAATTLWLWRLSNTALLAAGVWLLWRHVIALETMSARLIDLIDYLSLITERLG